MRGIHWSDIALEPNKKTSQSHKFQDLNLASQKGILKVSGGVKSPAGQFRKLIPIGKFLGYVSTNHFL